MFSYISHLLPTSFIVIKINIPSICLLGTVKMSSLVVCLCIDFKGNDVDVVCVAFNDDERDGGKSELHWECEFEEVLEDAANGTPVDGYKS